MVAMGPGVALSSSDGRFDIVVGCDEVELIASMLILLEVSRDTSAEAVHRLYAVSDRSHAA